MVLSHDDSSHRIMDSEEYAQRVKLEPEASKRYKHQRGKGLLSHTPRKWPSPSVMLKPIYYSPTISRGRLVSSWKVEGIM